MKIAAHRRRRNAMRVSTAARLRRMTDRKGAELLRIAAGLLGRPARRPLPVAAGPTVVFRRWLPPLVHRDGTRSQVAP
jgi:hypothetical protein